MRYACARLVTHGYPIDHMPGNTIQHAGTSQGNNYGIWQKNILTWKHLFQTFRQL